MAVKRKSMKIIMILTIIITQIFYLIVAIFGYLSFPDKFFTHEGSDNILNMYSDHDHLAIIARISALFTVVFCFPSIALPTKVSLINIARILKNIL